MGISFGDNFGEYLPEARTIVAGLTRARSVGDVRTLVHEEFVRWFDADIAGPEQRYEDNAREVWAIWLGRPSSPA